MDELVVGADLGGTSTRVTVATVGGARLVTVEGGGGNPTTHGAERAAAELAATARRALDGLEPGRVRAVVLGVAGRATLDDERAAGAFREALAAVGISVSPRYVGDAEVAFSSATAGAEGTVLLAGTGAMAVRIRDRRVDATADGLGWLLGDEGSAFWMGREAVRRAIAAICGTGASTALAGAVCGRLLGDSGGGSAERRRSGLIRAAAGQPPIELAALAPLVVAAEAAGDAVAATICDDAAARLVGLIGEVRATGESAPLVLNGSVVREPASPVGRRVRELIAGRFGGDVLAPADGLVGAAWLAVRSIRPEWPDQRLTEIHARLAG
ncbi:N-acetylglucosamine kinase [Paractinoplanes globisporus]|uniref:N-acetylglucosamine kinase n=1 Tax=Paractinoplanes globisporus TaxID=113565 RepID=A0ABW6W753_9ACTN|nr:BadF/BadG/BcrA/BcrD ATPase family protein [Actinoplanes globisporus]